MLITRQEASVTPELGEQSKLAEQKRDALGVGIAGGRSHLPVAGTSLWDQNELVLQTHKHNGESNELLPPW